MVFAALLDFGEMSPAEFASINVCGEQVVDTPGRRRPCQPCLVIAFHLKSILPLPAMVFIATLNGHQKKLRLRNYCFDAPSLPIPSPFSALGTTDPAVLLAVS